MQRNSELLPAIGETSVALGGFDGLHCGHQAVLQAALQGKEQNLIPAVFTFATLFSVKRMPQLMTVELREQLLEKMGFDVLWQPDFSAVSGLSPEEFVKKVLRDTLHARRVCCGFNYHFGAGGRGDAALLQRLGAENGMEIRVLPPVELAGQAVSSSRIREAVTAGEMELAEMLLGRPFSIDFPVAHGRQLGRRLGAPTINQEFPSDFILPRFGVYAAAAKVQGITYPAVSNVGIKPTVGAEAPLAETYLMDYNGDLYGQRVTVELLRFLRPERKFASVEELKGQIHADAEAVRGLFSNSI